MMNVIVQIIGWAGALLVVSAYILVSTKKVDGKDRLYQAFNLLGAIGVGLNALHQKAYPSLGIQIVWGVIAISTLIKVSQSKST